MQTGKRGYRPWSGAIASALALFLLAAGSVGAAPRPAPYSDTTTPINTITSYYNAIDRGELSRAYGYLVAQPRLTFQRWSQVFQVVPEWQLLSTKLLGYTDVSSVHAEMCVGVHLLASNRLGRQIRYHGWYVLEAMTGEEPNFGAWHIDPSLSHVFRDRRGIRPLQEAHCHVV